MTLKYKDFSDIINIIFLSDTVNFLSPWVILLTLIILSTYSLIILLLFSACFTTGVFFTAKREYAGNIMSCIKDIKPEFDKKDVMPWIKKGRRILHENLNELKIFVLDCAYMTKHSYFPWIDRIIHHIFQNNLKQKPQASQQQVFTPNDLLPHCINKLAYFSNRWNIYSRIKYFMTSSLPIEEALAVDRAYYANMVAEQVKSVSILDLSYRPEGGNSLGTRDSDLITILNAADELTALNLHNCVYISDKSIEVLANKHPNLKHLGLYLTPISDQGLKVLGENCKQLINLDIRDCKYISHTARDEIMEKINKNNRDVSNYDGGWGQYTH
ncbi:MAG TPA: hypothetical protein QF353_02550 [Gammaproteobacteria bacterium]|nr:hypothetical protein [Gammaproteobacteria bacterium]